MMAWFLRYSNLLARNLYTRWLMLSVIFHWTPSNLAEMWLYHQWCDEQDFFRFVICLQCQMAVLFLPNWHQKSCKKFVVSAYHLFYGASKNQKSTYFIDSRGTPCGKCHLNDIREADSNNECMNEWMNEINQLGNIMVFHSHCTKAGDHNKWKCLRNGTRQTHSYNRRLQELYCDLSKEPLSTTL